MLAMGVHADPPPKLLRLAIYDNPPHTFLDGGRPAGFIVDIAQAFCKQEGYRLHFVPGTFAESIARVMTGQADAIAPIAFTREREQRFLYSRESIVLDWSNVILPPQSDVKDLKGLAHCRIGGVRGDNSLAHLKADLENQGIPAQFVNFSDTHDLVRAVSRREIDAGFIGRFTLASILRMGGDRFHVQLMPDSLYHEPLFFAFARQRSDLREGWDRFIAAAKTRPQGPVQTAREKWFSESTHPSVLRFLANYYRQIVGSVALLIGIILIFNFVLGRRVKSSVREIARQKSFFQNLFQNIPVGIILLDRDFHPVEMNREFRQMFGFSLEEISSSSLDEQLAAAEDRGEARQLNERVLRGERVYHEGRRWTRDHRALEVQIIGAPIVVDGELAAVIGIYLDVTARKQLEEQLIKNRNIESIGILAGGIAHDFNNMLTGILGNLSLARLRATDPALRHSLEKAEKASLKAKGLTQQLLTFSKGGAPKKKAAPVFEILKDALDLVLSGSGVQRELTVEEGLPPVDVDVTQISQVFHNIIINAKEAMENSGHLEVTVRGYPQKTGTPFLGRGQYVAVAFTDHGPGISAKVMNNLFVPYHTTKESGSGLGLAISYSIVRKHNGNIRVHSVPGAGSTFTVYLPTSAKPVERESPPPSRSLRPGRVLLMDDEEMVREVFRDMLAGTPIRLDTTCGSQEAMAAYRQARQEGDPYDLVFLDLTVPGDIGGIKTLQRLRTADPVVKAIATSGYSDSEVFSDPGKYHFLGIMAKPFRREDLLAILGKYL